MDEWQFSSRLKGRLSIFQEAALNHKVFVCLFLLSCTSLVFQVLQSGEKCPVLDGKVGAPSVILSPQSQGTNGCRGMWWLL